VLSKKKKIFHRTDIVIPALPIYRALSMKRMIEVAKASKVVMEYLTDEDSLTPKRINREFIATIMNTLDPTFFPEAIDKADMLKTMKNSAGPEEFI